MGEVCCLEEAIFSDPWSPGSLLSSFESPHSVFLAATDEGGELLGYAVMYCIAGEAEILNIAVSPAARRRGIGSALMEEMLRRGESAGCELFFLEARESNSAAIALYEKYSFRAVGRRKRYYTRPTEDAIEMQRGNNADLSS